MRGYDREPTERDTDVVGDRILAVFVDGIVVGIGTMVLLFVFAFAAAGLASSAGGGGAFARLFGGALLVVWLAGPFAYWLLLEGLWDGQTVGKKLAGIKVVMDDGSECTMLASTIRNVVRVIDLLPQFYIVGLVAMLASDRRKRVGDVAAGTVVVEEPPEHGRRDDRGRERDRTRGRGREGDRRRERMVSERGRGREGDRTRDRDRGRSRSREGEGRDDRSDRY